MKSMSSTNAVSEIVGTMLLLIISLSALSVVYYTVLSDEGPSEYINAEIGSSIDGLDMVLLHQGGHPLSLDTKISILIGNDEEEITVRNYLSSDDLSDGYWNVGEKIVYPIQNIYRFNCIYGDPALDFQVEDIMDPPGSTEQNLSTILANYNGPTNLSGVSTDIQWGRRSVETGFTAIDPQKNRITFHGPINLDNILDYQEWGVNNNISEIDLTFEYIDGIGSNTNTFFYYVDRDNTTISKYSQITNKASNIGKTWNYTIDILGHSSIGFGIESKSSSYAYWYTNHRMNENQIKQVLVYDIGKTELGPKGSYLLAFEDLDRNSPTCDSDFQDFIIIVHVVDCG